MHTDFSKLNDIFFNISSLFPVRQQETGKTSFQTQKPRSTDALLLFTNATAICYQNDCRPLYIPRGALVYMPKGSHYIWEFSPAQGSNIQERLLFEFNLEYTEISRSPAEYKYAVSHSLPKENIILGNRVFIVSFEHSAHLEKLFIKLIDAFNAPRFSPLSLYSVAYDIFKTISSYARLELENPVNTNVIKPGIKYLTDINSTKSIKDIAALCNVSTGYFEKLFRHYAGISPTEYRNLHRINNIKMYLQNDKLSLDEISEMLGYCDAGYLCRIFKKKTGMTPNEYRKTYYSQTTLKRNSNNKI